MGKALLKNPILSLLILGSMLVFWGVAAPSNVGLRLSFPEGGLMQVWEPPLWAFSTWSTLVLDFFSIGLLVLFLLKVKFIEQEWGWVALQFFTVLFFVPEWRWAGIHHWALPIFLFTLWQVKGLAHEKKLMVKGYDTGFLLGILPLLTPSFSFLSVVLLLLAAVIGTLRIRTLLLFFLGLLSPLFLFVSILFLVDEGRLTIDLLANYRWFFPDFSFFTNDHFYGLAFGMALTLGVSLFPLERGKLVFQRRINQAFVFCGLVLMGYGLLVGESALSFWMILSPFVAFGTMRAIGSIRVWWLQDSLLFLQWGLFFVMYL
jgi:hypothetical protein